MSKLPDSWENLRIPEKIYHDANKRMKLSIENILIQQFGVDMNEAIRLVDNWDIGNLPLNSPFQVSEWLDDPFPFAGRIIVETRNLKAWNYYCEHAHKNHIKVKKAVQTLFSINNYSF